MRKLAGVLLDVLDEWNILHETQPLRPLRVEVGRPGLHDPVDVRVVPLLHQGAPLPATDLLQGIEHLLDGDLDSGEVHGARLAKSLPGDIPRVHQVFHHRVRGADPHLSVPAHGEDGLPAVERLPDDIAREAARGLRGPSSPDGDGGQPHGASVQEPPPRIVVDQDLDDELLRAVGRGRHRGDVGLVDDEAPRGRAVDGEGGGVDDLDAGHGGPEPVKDVAGGIEVHVDPQLEVGFGATGHDAMEDVDGVVRVGVLDERVDDLRQGEVGLEAADARGMLGGRGRHPGRDDVGDGDDGLGRGGMEEGGGQFLSDVAAGARDEDGHGGRLGGCRREEREKTQTSSGFLRLFLPAISVLPCRQVEGARLVQIGEHCGVGAESFKTAVEKVQEQRAASRAVGRGEPRGVNLAKWESALRAAPEKSPAQGRHVGKNSGGVCCSPLLEIPPA